MYRKKFSFRLTVVLEESLMRAMIYVVANACIFYENLY